MLKETIVNVTAVFRKVPEGYIGYIEEIPGANTQGTTLEETRENLKEALKLVLETNREIAEKEIEKDEILRESLSVKL